MRIKQIWDVAPLPSKLRLAVRTHLDYMISDTANTIPSTPL